MIKKVFIFLTILLIAEGVFAQKPQRIAYIDMEYILENIPDYQKAETQLQTKVQVWQDIITTRQREIESMKTDLSNEKALLTKDMVEEREEDITIKTEELKKIQNNYFGTKGDLYRLRKQLAKPVQDQVYNAIQDIAKKRRYDFVIDKSSDLIMLYTNEKFDISDLVIRSITRTEKQKAIEERKAKKQAKIKKDKEPDPERSKKISEREAKRKELLERVAAQKAEWKRRKEEKRKALQEAREKKAKEREEARKKAVEARKKAREEKKKQQEQDGN